MLPKVSIIVPLYNAETTLSKCIESILSLQYRDFELLLINDGSTDSSLEICEEYRRKDPRIRLFVSENRGVSSARNIGLDNASGEWIVFVDSDDMIDPDFLNVQFDADFIVQKFCSIQERTCVEPISPFYSDDRKQISEFFKEHLHKIIFRVPWGKIYKKSIINENNIRFIINVRLGEDTLFNVGYIKHCRSLRVTASSFYLHQFCVDFVSKYKLDVTYVLKYFELFWTVYEGTPYKSDLFVCDIYDFLCALIPNRYAPDVIKALNYDSNVLKFRNVLRKRYNLNYNLWYYKCYILAFFKRIKSSYID